jgi:arabinofuranosyltransferase
MNMTPTKARLAPRDRWLVALPLILLFTLLVLRTAWVMDDAYISFRSVDNFVHGFGLRWNTFERVDAFTDPLWTLVLSVCAFVTREVYYTGLLLQIAFSVAAFIVIVMAMARTTAAAVVCSVVLAFSKAFVDYSTSGLENPLSHAPRGLGAFFTILLRCVPWDDRGGRADRRLLFRILLAGRFSRRA